MTEITPELVRHLAGLARIEVTGAEVDQFASQLALIVDSVATVKAVASQDINTRSNNQFHSAFAQTAIGKSTTNVAGSSNLDIPNTNAGICF